MKAFTSKWPQKCDVSLKSHLEIRPGLAPFGREKNNNLNKVRLEADGGGLTALQLEKGFTCTKVKEGKYSGGKKLEEGDSSFCTLEFQV